MARQSKLSNKTNAQILNAMAEVASPQLANAIGNGNVPEGANILQMNSIYEQIKSNDILTNEFMSTLINVIGAIDLVNKDAWDNPFADFIKDKDIYGSEIGLVAMNLMPRIPYKPRTSSTNPGEQFKTRVPDAKEQFFGINKRGVFPTTFTDVELQKAFLSNTGLANFTTLQMTKLFDSAKEYEFSTILGLLTDAYKYNRVLMKKVDDPLASAENARKLIKKIRADVTKFQYYRTDYNRAEMNTFVSANDLYLFISADLEATVDVDVLAAAFHMEKTEFLGHVKIVPEFNGLPVQAFLCGRDALVLIRTFYETKWNQDAQAATRNVFLHDQLIAGFCSMVNAIAYTTADVYDTKVTGVEVTATGGASTIKPGTTLKFSATVTGDDGNKVYWEIRNTKYEDYTYISDDGTLYVAGEEPIGTKLEVVAYAQNNVEVQSTPVIITVTN